MQKLMVSEIVKATGGVLVRGQENAEITNITRNSNDAAQGSLFVPLKGERRDGHDFIDDALGRGASAVITSKPYTSETDAAVIEVRDTLIALGDIARYYKKRCNIPTVTVTGSVGKTTTKDMIYSAIAAGKNAVKTQKNYNNSIGVPETVFTIEKEHEAAVIEMGMNHTGEIDYLASIVCPDAAVITNIGMSHIGNFADGQQGIFKAKMEVANHLSKDAALIVNGDDKFLGTVKGTVNCKVIRYGITNSENDVKAYDIVNHGLLGVSFKTIIDGKEYSVNVKIPGRHNVYNALAAICAARYLNVGIDLAIKGIENTVLTENRLEIAESNDLTIIKDYYNASPDSVKSALEILSYGKDRKVAILGDILEMGTAARDAHYNLGANVVKNSIDLLITAGENAKYIAAGARDAGMTEVFTFDTTKEAAAFSKEALKSGDSVLIKASNGMKFGEIFDTITEK